MYEAFLIIGAVGILLITPLVWWIFEKKAILLKLKDIQEILEDLKKRKETR